MVDKNGKPDDAIVSLRTKKAEEIVEKVSQNMAKWIEYALALVCVN
jgi:hypothetical protein